MANNLPITLRFRAPKSMGKRLNRIAQKRMCKPAVILREGIMQKLQEEEARLGMNQPQQQ